MSLKTLEKRQLTRAETPIGDVKAAVSPDGTTLAFIRSGIPGLCDVYVVPMSGGEPRRVTDWNSLIEGLAWTPDGKEIIYGVYEPVGPRLWRIPADASSPGRGVRLAESTGDAVLPSISKSDARGHARLAYFTRRLEISLRLVDLTQRDASGALTTSKRVSAFVTMGLRREASHPTDGWSRSFRIAPERPKSGCRRWMAPTSAG